MRKHKFLVSDSNGNWLDLSVPKKSISDQSSIIRESTGLKDVDGKEIYEGDIIDFLKGDELCDTPCCVRWHPYLTLFYLCFSHEDAPKENDTKASLGEMIHNHHYQAKVLGNIYDNPDLLPDISPYMICGGK